MTSEQQVKTDNRPRPTTEQFRAFVREGWAPRSTELPARAEVAPYAAARREALSAAYPGERLVIPAGGLKVRSKWEIRRRQRARGVQEGSARRRSSASAESAWWVPWGSNPQPTD